MLTKKISKDNYLLRIAQTYPIYEKPVDDICRLFRRILASFMITAMATMAFAGTVIVFLFWDDIVSLPLLLKVSVIFSFLFWVFVVAFGIFAAIFALFSLIETKIQKYPHITQKIHDFFCKDISNKFSYLKKIVVQYDGYLHKSVNNSCVLFSGLCAVFIVISMLTFVGACLLSVPTMILMYFIADFPLTELIVGDDILGVLFTIGIALYCILFVCVMGFYKGKLSERRNKNNKTNKTNKSNWSETKETLDDIKESKLKKLCFKLQIGDIDNG